jgi:Putative peptidoglycan binding domain
MRRLLVSVAATLFTLGAGLVAATPAQAAAPTCTSWTTIEPPYAYQEVIHVPSAGYQTGRLDCILKRGHRNDAVKVLQRALRFCHAKGYVEVDGDYGSNTHLGVWTFQNFWNSYGAGLVEDGEYGPATRRWMNYVIYTWPANQQTPWCHESPY